MNKHIKRTTILIIFILGIIGCNDSNNWIHYDDNGLSVPERTWRVIIDGNDDLWFTAYDGKVFYYDHSENQWMLKFIPEEIGLGNNVLGLSVDLGNDILIGTSSGLGRYNPRENQWRLYTEGDAFKTEVRAILQDRNSTLWVGTENGLFVSEDDGESWQKVTIEEGFSSFSVNQIFEDSRNDIWIATGGALFRYTRGTQSWSTFTDGSTRYNSNTDSYTTSPTDQPILVDDLVLSIFEDSNGFLWFGTFGGVNKYAPLKNTWIDFTTDDGLINNEVWAINEDHENNLWFGTSSGISRYNPNSNQWTSYNEANGFTDRSVSGIVVDVAGQVWVATFGSGVYQYVLEK